MLSKDMVKAINDQINKELYSAYYYLAMAAFFETENLDGMAQFMKVQAEEEVEHAMKFYNYVNDQGGHVELETIEKPKTDFKDAEEIFTLALEHEKFVTSRIHALVDQALKENDHATKAFLDWYVTEQVEEEATMDSILGKVKVLGKSGHGLFMLDAQLGQRKSENESEE